MAIEPVIIDARGLKCPLPVLKMEKQLVNHPIGRDLVVLATDPMAKVDIPLFCRHKGFLCQVEAVEGVLQFTISTANA